MKAQMFTGIAAVLGCIVGLVAGEFVESTMWMLPYTAGGFIYIATVDVIPDLLQDTSVGQTIKELITIALGIGMMTLIALNE